MTTTPTPASQLTDTEMIGGQEPVGVEPHANRTPASQQSTEGVLVKENRERIEQFSFNQQPSPARSDKEAGSEWRRLALQLDGHRMAALGHLRCLMQDFDKHAPIVSQFLAAPPLSGEAVLAERLAAIAGQAQESAPSSEEIATWKERAEKELGKYWSGYKPDSFMLAEIADLRAALARRATAGTTAAPAQAVESIDGPEFQALLDDMHGAAIDAHACGNEHGTGARLSEAESKLIAFIDARISVLHPEPTTTNAVEWHNDDYCVDNFALAMRIKMAESRAKERSGWDDPAQCTLLQLQTMLVDHVLKGDPVDVGNFAMMLFHRGAKTFQVDS